MTNGLSADIGGMHCPKKGYVIRRHVLAVQIDKRPGLP
jgi:hypothetical protein